MSFLSPTLFITRALDQHCECNPWKSLVAGILTATDGRIISWSNKAPIWRWHKTVARYTAHISTYEDIKSFGYTIAAAFHHIWSMILCILLDNIYLALNFNLMNIISKQTWDFLMRKDVDDKSCPIFICILLILLWLVFLRILAVINHWTIRKTQELDTEKYSIFSWQQQFSQTGFVLAHA